MRRLLLLLLTLLAAAPHPAQAAASAWQRDADAGARLIAATDATGAETSLSLGLEIDLAPGWHTYWRSPGDAGLPPQLDWKASQTAEGNLQNADLLYPAPRRYSALGMETIGYRDHVVFPINAQLRAPDQPLRLEANLDLLVCSDICVPKHFTLRLDLPSGEAAPSAEAALIEKARAQVPGDAQKSGLTITSVQRQTETLKIAIAGRAPLIDPDLFIETDENIAFDKPNIVVGADKHTAAFTLKPLGTLPKGITLATLPFTVTVVDGDRALEQKLDETFIAPSANVQPEGTALGCILLIALLGGFILNLMPCVLPVLSLKILSVISHGGGAKRDVRRSFLMTAAGILFSFLALAGATIALKQAGHAIGWGVQFQQPVFLVLLIVVLTFFAASLWGFLDIPLPRFLADRLDPRYHPKRAGDFFSGAFATLLATPCTAPFLGTAVGFALASGPRDILLVFAALGLGMTLPYLAIALWPRLATMFPRPGKWMVTLRHLLGWALALTALWLMWVLAGETALAYVVALGSCMLALLALLHGRKRGRFPAFLRSGIVVLLALAFAAALMTATPSNPSTANWQPFDESAIARHVAEGKTVFVDVTADWCLTCKANKKFTLEREDITRRLFATPNVIAMQADWTNPDPVIAAFLKKFGRYGIPFNVVFGPSLPNGLVLSELLTPRAVKDGLARAEKKP